LNAFRSVLSFALAHPGTTISSSAGEQFAASADAGVACAGERQHKTRVNKRIGTVHFIREWDFSISIATDVPWILSLAGMECLSSL
jgi:hypothetical protein